MRARAAATPRAKRSREELHYVRGQGQRPEGATPRPRPGAAWRSHFTPKAKGSGPEEPPRAQGQGRQSGGATRGAMTVGAQEGLEELSHTEGQEGHQ